MNNETRESWGVDSRHRFRFAATCLAFALIYPAGRKAGRGTAGYSFFDSLANPQARSGNIIVHPRFGEITFSFDIIEMAVFAKASGAKRPESNGTIIAAVETFDPSTGKIIKIVSKTQTQDDFVTLGIVGNSVGLVEREHVVSLFHVQRTFNLLNPVGGNKITGSWTPPIDQAHVVNEVSRAAGSPNVAVYALDTSTKQRPVVFSSNVAANTFGAALPVVDNDFNFEQSPSSHTTASRIKL